MCPDGCIQYLVIPFNAINAEGVLSFEHINPVGNDPTLVKYQYGRVRVFDSSGEIYNSGKLKSSQSIQKNLFQINGSGFIVVEAYGMYMRISGTQLKFWNNDPNPKNNYGSGLRIKSISNYNLTNERISKKEYEYINSSNKSSGLLINELSNFFQSNSVTNYFHSCCNIINPGGGSVFGCEWAENINTNYSSNSISGVESNGVVYTDVIEKNIDINNSNNGFTIYKFSNEADNIIDNKGLIKIDYNHKRGKLIAKEVYKKSSNNISLLINKITNNYIEDTRLVSNITGFKLFQHHNLQGMLLNNTLPQALSTLLEPVGYNVQIPWFYQNSTETTDYFYNSSNTLTGSVTNTTNYFYDNLDHLQLTRTESSNSNNETVKTVNYYPHDLVSSVPIMSSLISKNRIGEVVKTENFKNNNLLSSRNTIYKDWGNNLILPEIIQSSKGSPASFENRIRFNIVDNTNGNPLELQQENGTVVTYLWGYNKTLPIAKIENATNAQVQTALGINLSDVTEANMSVINGLRSSLPNAMISTYTHIPLVGVSTITDPKGDTITYTYDSFNRLKEVQDKNGNKLSENEYHYRP